MKKAIALILALLACFSLLAGCGSTPTTDAPATDAPATDGNADLSNICLLYTSP